MSDAAALDPEEAFVASLSSCHMLWFLSIAAKASFVVNRYIDHAIGELGRNSEGKLVVTSVRLRPYVEWSEANLPTQDRINEMHQSAHGECFIANSVKSDVRIEPVGCPNDLFNEPTSRLVRRDN